MPQLAFSLLEIAYMRSDSGFGLSWLRDSSVGIAVGYGLDDRGSRVRFSAGSGNSSLHQYGSGARPASYPMGTSGSFPGGKASRA
jgi:hypothetical protein